MTERDPVSTPAVPGGLPFDATQIQFLQAGAGAVSRTLQAKDRDIVSVKDFGAVGDGVTDDGAAVTTAIAAIPPSGGTLYFPSATYAYATSPNFAKTSLSIVCGQGTIFKHTGTGNAFSCDAGANPAFVNGMTIENIILQGNANSTNGFYFRGIGRSAFRNLVDASAATTGAGLRCEFCLLNTWVNFRVNTVGFTPIPLYGIYLTRRNAGENTTTQTFINPCIESVTTAGGAGIYIDYASGNSFFGGTSESNDLGIWITTNGAGDNLFVGTDLEGNAVADVAIVSSNNNSFHSIASNGLFSIQGTAKSNSIYGGVVGTLTLPVGTLLNGFHDLGITTALTDNSVSSTFLNCTVAGAAIANKINNANLVMANSLQPPSPRTGTSATDTITSADSAFIANRAGTITLTLETASSVPGRQLMVRTIQAQTVVSASSNVVPRAGGAAGTAILAAVAGNWALLQSDGSSWQVMAGS